MDCFAHDWIQAPSMSTEWQTDIVASPETLAEDRRGLVSKPRRTISLRWLGSSQGEAGRILFALMRAHDEEFEVPLYQDIAVTTAASSGTTIYCPTENRRFAPGSRVVIVAIGTDGRPMNPQWRTIDTIGPTDLALTAALAGSYAAGSLVFPAAQARLLLDAEMTLLTDGKVRVDATFEERLKDAIPAFTTYDDLETDYAFNKVDVGAGVEYYLLDLGVNWKVEPSLRVARSGARHRVGQDDVVIVRGPRPLLRFVFTHTVVSRLGFARALAFFDAHRGALIPFLVVNPLTLWTIHAVATTYVEVAVNGALADVQDFVDFVAVEAGGEVYVRPVTGTALVGGYWRMTLGVNLPALSVGDVTRVTSAHLCRFESDALEEVWKSATVAEIGFDVAELVNEQTAEIADPTWTAPPCVGEPY